MNDRVILYIGGFELPDKNAAAHRVLSNAKIFRELGKKVVFVGIDKTLAPNSDVIQTHSMIEGFHSFAVPYPRGKMGWLKYLTNISDYIRVCEKLGIVEMVIFYNFQSIAMKKLISYCKKHNIKQYADITEWRSAKGERLVYRILKDSDTWYRMHILHKKLDGLIVISRYLENYYKICKNVIYIPALTDSSEEKWQGSYTKSKEVLKLVYAGNPGRKDRLDKLIEALDKVERRYLLDVIGITIEQYLSYYPNHKEILEKNRSIVFHGHLPHLETLEYIKRANYSCFLREDNRVSKAGFPTKFTEAITCGTPIITNKTSNLEDYADGKVNGYLINTIEPKVMQELIDRIPYVIDVERELFDFHRYLNDMRMLFNKL